MPIESLDGTREAYIRELELTDFEPARVDPVTLEIVKNRLETIANEMGIAMQNTAHTVIFAETKDFSCAIFDHEAHMVATGEFLPAHQAGAQAALDGLIAEVGLESFRDGDIFMCNDAFYGAWHAPDITLYAPIFHSGELVGIVGVVAHHIDIGGMTPAGYAPAATEIYQEGIRFPPTRLFEHGKLREDILNIFRTNVRLPEQQTGDIMAQVAALHAGKERVLELASKHGAQNFKQYLLAIQANSMKTVRRAIRERLTPGVYEAEDFVDGDGVVDRSYRVVCRMTVEEEKLTIDFTGTDAMAQGFINSRWGSTSANCFASVFSYLIPQEPKTYGATVPITLVAERGSLVNATGSAPVGACTTESGYAIHSAVHLCLAQAFPEMASGVWGGTIAIPLIWGEDPATSEYFITMLQSGQGAGGGARRTLDGWPNATLKGSNVWLPNIEIEEQLHPIRYSYRRMSRDDEPGGAGAGRMRGGPGINFDVRPLGTALQFTTVVSRTTHPPAGVYGGEPGGKSRIEVRNVTTGAVRVLGPKTSDKTLQEDEALHVVVAGGGGYGPPEERVPEAVRADVLDGFVSLERARTVYRVALDPETLEVDDAGTASLRATGEPEPAPRP